MILSRFFRLQNILLSYPLRVARSAFIDSEGFSASSGLGVPDYPLLIASHFSCGLVGFANVKDAAQSSLSTAPRASSELRLARWGSQWGCACSLGSRATPLFCAPTNSAKKFVLFCGTNLDKLDLLWYHRHTNLFLEVLHYV